jgi:glycosyltransferase involved in cell wall biosynthesis
MKNTSLGKPLLTALWRFCIAPKRRYRVLLVSAHPVQYASPTFRRMAKHPQLDINVAYCSLQGAEPGIDPEFGVQVQWDVPLLEGYPWVQTANKSLRPGLGRFLGLINPGLWKLVSEGSYDAVVAYTGYAYASFWIALVASKRSGVPILFGTDATGLKPLSGGRWKIWLKRWLLPIIFRLATVAIAPSAATAEYLQNLGVPAERVIVTPFVVDNEYWTQKASTVDRAAVRVSWGCSTEEPVVLFCAKLQPWKRPEDALRAFARAQMPNARLVIAGDGPLRAELEAESRLLGVSDRVIFLGFTNQSQLPALYRAADVMILSSEYDACPAVVCEAMLCGCPVILSDKIRGRAELIRQGETGFFYPCGDVNALAALLRDVLSDHDRLRSMSEAARQRMVTWSPEANVRALVKAVERAIAVMHP